MKQGFIPATFQRVGHQSIGRIYFLITPFGKSNFVFGALESHLPLTQNGLIAYFEFSQSAECQLEFGWSQRFQHFFRNGGIEQITTKAQAILGRQSFTTLSVAKVGRIDAAVAGVTDGDGVATVAAQEQSLQQSQAFASRAAQHRCFPIRAVLFQALAIFQEFVPADVSVVMLSQLDAPIGHGDRTHFFLNLTGRADLLMILVATKDIHAGIRWVLEQAQHTRVSKTSPHQLAIPGPAVTAFWKTQSTLAEVLSHAKTTTSFAKQATHQGPGAAHFFVGVKDNMTILVVTESNGEWKSQFPFLRFIEFTAQEARA